MRPPVVGTRVLLVTPFYPPDLGPSAPLVRMLAEDLAGEGCTVTVICAVPHFPSGFVAQPYRKGVFFSEVVGGVKVLRVRVPSGDRNNLLHRALGFLAFQVLAGLAALAAEHDVAIVTNPGIESLLPLAAVTGVRRRPSLYCVWDLYPDVGVESGVLRGAFMKWLVGTVEGLCYRWAAGIQVLSKDMAVTLERRRDFDAAVVEIPVPVDLTRFAAKVRQVVTGGGSRTEGAPLVALYSGNIGKAQGFQELLDVAERKALRHNTHFLLFGEGAGRPALEEEVRRRRLENVVFRDLVEPGELPGTLEACDVGLVLLRSGVGRSVLPSKVFPLMAMQRPILAVADAGCALWRLVETSGCGLCVTPGDSDGLARALEVLRCDPPLRYRMGKVGRDWVEARLGRRAIARTYLAVLEGLAGSRVGA